MTVADTDFGDLTERRLGDFRLLRRLGRGGMADVYLAEQTSLSRQVAVKVLRSDALTGSDDVMLQRFRQEAKSAAGLNHPNIVHVYAVGEQEGLHYIVQEYVEGRNLSEYLRRNGPPDAASAIHITRQVASALKAADEAGIVHRDIKPENIMLTRSGDGKVADFGLAQLTQPGEKLNLTQAGTTMGTPLYMSPEQVNGRQLDHRSDIYSLGVTCYHMLAGRPPFRGETAMSVAVQHLNDAAPPLHKRRSDLPRDLCEIVHRMIAKSPQDRYQHASELLDAIDRVAGQLSAADIRLAFEDDDLPRSLWSRLRTPAMRRTVTRGLATCAAVAAMAGLPGWWLRPVDPLKTRAAAAAKQPGFKKELTRQRQFFVAQIIERDNETAWQAVIDHYPNTLEATRARKQLGLLNLRLGNNLEKSRYHFEQLARMENKLLKAQGLAGLVIVAVHERDFRTAKDIDDNQLRRPLEDKLRDDDVTMSELLDQAKQEYTLHFNNRGVDEPG